MTTPSPPTTDIVSDSSQEQCERKIESRFIRVFSVPLKSVKLIHFLTKLKCFVLPAEARG